MKQEQISKLSLTFSTNFPVYFDYNCKVAVNDSRLSLKKVSRFNIEKKNIILEFFKVQTLSQNVDPFENRRRSSVSNPKMLQ